MTSVPMDPLQLAAFLQQLAADAKFRAQAAAEPTRDIHQVGFNDVVLDLANAKVISGTNFTSGRGFGFTFLRRHSSPGAQLVFNNAGVGLVGGFGMGPGDWIEGSFDGDQLQVARAPSSVTAGRAVLRVWLNPQARFRENEFDELPVEPFALLGGVSSDGAPTFITLLEDAEPVNGTVSSATGTFDVTGWKRLMVLIDAQSAGDEAISFALDPYWAIRGAGGTWYTEGETQRITFAGSLPAQARFRAAVVDLAPTPGWLGFMPRLLENGSRTGLGLLVLGIG